MSHKLRNLICLGGFAFLLALAAGSSDTPPSAPPAGTASTVPSAPAAGREPAGTTPVTPEVPAKPANKWTGGESTSAMDDTKTVVFQLEAENEIEGWLAKERPTLVVRCQERKTDAYVVTNMPANPELGEYQRHTVQIRFDERQAASQMWSASTDDKALFVPNAIQFSRNIAKAKRLRMRFTPFNASPQTIEFDVRGFDEHLPTLGKTCGWK